jgi:hypothetical protein
MMSIIIIYVIGPFWYGNLCVLGSILISVFSYIRAQIKLEYPSSINENKKTVENLDCN